MFDSHFQSIDFRTMNIAILKEIIQNVGQCQSGGFGYVESFMDSLREYRAELKIGMGCVYWQLEYKKRYYQWAYFMSQRISLDAFNLEHIMAHEIWGL